MQKINGIPFWRHPSTGWNDSNRGLTDTQLRRWEDAIAFTLPDQFRLLMAEQNGGELRRPVLDIDNGETIEVSIDPAPLEASASRTVRDLILHTLGEKELVTICSSNAPCFPERAVLIARLTGHDCMVLDYGWREEHLKDTPGIAVLAVAGDFPYEAIWSVESFAALLEQLGPPEDDGRRVLGLVSAQPFDQLAEGFARWLADDGLDNTSWKAIDGGHQGAVPLEITSEVEAIYCRNYNLAPEEFADWLGAEGRRRWITAQLKPNQFSDGAWQYPEHPDVTAILEISRTWFETTPALPHLANEIRARDELACSRVVEITT